MKKFAFVLLFLGLTEIGFSKSLEKIFKIDSIELQDYVGKYKFEKDNFLAFGEIYFESGNLFFQTEGLPKFLLKPKPEKDFFTTAEYEILVQFTRSEFKEVIGAKLTFQGQEFKAEKIYN
jgi:hypothetical protein